MAKNVAYVVLIGRTPGIYESWAECNAQVHEYPGAKFKGHRQYEDAIKQWEAFEQQTGYGEEEVNNEPVSPTERDAKVLNGKLCPYCWRHTVLADSAEIYNGRSYGMIWICRPCRAYVGCHKGSNKALGRLANAELRTWKKAFHAAFDPIWKNGVEARGELYSWLAGKMGMDVQRCHGGMFDVGQCKKAIELLNRHFKLSRM